MLYLLEPAGTSSQLAEVSGDFLPPAKQRAWLNQGRFFTPVPPGRPGRERQWPLLAFYEAALIGAIGRAGFDTAIAHEAFSVMFHRLETEKLTDDERIDIGAAARDAGQDRREAIIVEVLRRCTADDIPEFGRTAPSDNRDMWFLTLIGPVGEFDGHRTTLDAITLVRGPVSRLPAMVPTIPPDMARQGFLAVHMVLDVTAAVQRVHDVIGPAAAVATA
ncbi:hypothetical protein [Roseospira goensis]|uniref:Uncharacterized protein n=1 Tax=Roseospira goensis TaxID=391922 RepID=A0A7W6S3J5_9PROT|nr:hypothetical protein [Roseospira goensis]MBB4287514.1 hypothetical protein [Roseospira goensis]